MPRYEKWLSRHTHSLAGKTVALTGSTGGLGNALSRYLARLGASLILLDRNAEKSAAWRDRLGEEFPKVQIKCIRVDLEDMGSVREAVARLKEEPLDLFIHNAGAYSIPRHKCDTGFDNVFQINFVSPYYMIRELLPLLRERRGRVVAVSSIAHNYSKTDPTDVDFSTRRQASLVYGNAKRYLTYALGALFSEESEASLSITHPGISLTGITAHYPKVIFALIKHPMKVIFMRPPKAALSILLGVFESTGDREWIGPRLFDVWGLPKKKLLCTATEEERRRITGAAEEIYEGLKKEE
ncbi:MAG: SDR family NAD(P)-dependent oxidoreductase [Clostridia bacterium]|nr:SDR family NAD(P)-dependent oxidoreductase [Clostridia bacterium]